MRGGILHLHASPFLMWLRVFLCPLIPTSWDNCGPKTVVDIKYYFKYAKFGNYYFAKFPKVLQICGSYLEQVRVNKSQCCIYKNVLLISKKLRYSLVQQLYKEQQCMNPTKIILKEKTDKLWETSKLIVTIQEEQHESRSLPVKLLVVFEGKY